MSEEKENIRQKKACKICGIQKGVISKYNLNICKRCFKRNAKRLGFEKYD
jgi:ribosomal protein S14